MATKINVIVSEDCVWATYVETICFKQQFKNQNEKDDAIREAFYLAFSYSLSFGHVFVKKIELEYKCTDNDIFLILKKQHSS